MRNTRIFNQISIIMEAVQVILLKREAALPSFIILALKDSVMVSKLCPPLIFAGLSVLWWRCMIGWFCGRSRCKCWSSLRGSRLCTRQAMRGFLKEQLRKLLSGLTVFRLSSLVLSLRKFRLSNSKCTLMLSTAYLQQFLWIFTPLDPSQLIRRWGLIFALLKV